MWPYQQVPESAYPEYNNYGELPEDPYISRDYLDQEYNGENVQVMDEDWDDEPYMDLEDSWIPYSPPEPQKSSPSTNVQQVVIGVPSTPHIQFPQASDLNTYFCQLHPQECRGREGGLPARNMTCTTNCTVGEDDTGGSTLLKRVNVSGFGVALLVALLIFLGLHVGWDREQSETTGKKGKGHSKSKDPEKTPDPTGKTGKGTGNEDESIAQDPQQERLAPTVGAANTATREAERQKQPTEEPERARKGAAQIAENEKNIANPSRNNMGGNTNSVPLDGNPTQIPLDENTTQASEGMNPIMNSTGKTPEQDQATQARQQAESDLRKKNNALNTAERTAVNDAARANRNQKPTSIPQTPQVQQADIDQKKAERALRDAEKMENDVYGQAIQKPGSRSRIGPTAQAEAADRAERERQKQQPQPAAPTVDPSNGGKRQNQPGAQTLVPVNPSTGGNRRDQARGGGANPPGGGANPPPEGATPATVGGANPLRGGANPAPVGAATLASEGASPATVGGANRSGGGANPSLERAVNPSTGGSRQDQPRATSPGQVLPDGRDLTPSQARKEKEDARKVQNEAKQDEKAEKDKALSGASDTPEWKRKREKREEARRNLAQADANEKSAIAKAKAGQGGNIAQPGGAANPTPAPVQAAAENNSQVPPATTPSGQVQPDGRDLTPSLAKKEKKEAQQAYNEAKKQEKAEKDKAFSSGASDTPKWRQAREKLEEARKKLAQADANEKHAIAKANAGQGGDGAHPGAAANPPRRGLANPPPGGAASPAPVESPPVVAVQEDEGSTSSSARKFWPFLLCLPLLLLLLPRSSGTSRAASAKSAVRLTNPTSPAPKWVVKDTPPVQINNVHAQGSDIPVNIGGGDGFVLPSMSYELPEINFTGPAEPARIVGMLAAVAIIMLPLFLDYMRDSTARIYVKTKYRSALVHWLILGVAALFLLWKADHELGITTRYSRPAATVANGVGSGIGPAIVAGVETTERLLWGAEDLIFGDGKYLLGLVLAAGFGVVLSQRSPKKDTNLANYASPASQALYAAGAVVVGFLLSNA